MQLFIAGQCLTLLMAMFVQQDKNETGKEVIAPRDLPWLELLPRLSVTWEKPLRKSRGYPLPKIEFPFNVQVLQKEGTKTNVDWKLPLEVVVVRQPGKKVDWAIVGEEEVVRCELRLSNVDGLPKSKPGRWIGQIDAAALNLIIDDEADFQCCVRIRRSALPFVERRNHLIPDSVTMLRLPGPGKMDDVLVAINHCPTIYDYETFNPINVVKAVNPLIRLGREKAIEKLKSYHQIAGFEMDRTLFRPESSDTATRWCLEVIRDVIIENDLNSKTHPLSNRDVVVQDGIPFRPHKKAFFGSPQIDLSKMLDHMQRDGKFLTKELIPSSNPLRSVVTLFEKIKRPEYVSDQSRRDGRPCRTMYDLRRQAWLMVKDQVPELKEGKLGASDKEWQEYIEMVDLKKLRWNMELNKYEVGQK